MYIYIRMPLTQSTRSPLLYHTIKLKFSIAISTMQSQVRRAMWTRIHSARASHICYTIYTDWSPVSIQTQRTQRNRLRCVRCVNENRKQRERLIGCFDDWLFRSTIPIGWRLRALRLNGNRFYAMFFCLRNFIAFIAFLAHFSYAIDCVACVACVAFGWKPGLWARNPTPDCAAL